MGSVRFWPDLKRSRCAGAALGCVVNEIGKILLANLVELRCTVQSRPVKDPAAAFSHNQDPLETSRCSEYVNCRKRRCLRHTVPEVHRKADIAGPQRVPPPTELIARFAALGCGSHGECSGAF